MQPKVKTKSF